MWYQLTGLTVTGLTKDDARWIARLIVYESGDVARQGVDRYAEWQIVASVAANRRAGGPVANVTGKSWNRGQTIEKLQTMDSLPAFPAAEKFAERFVVGAVPLVNAYGFSHTAEKPKWATDRVGRMWVRYADKY